MGKDVKITCDECGRDITTTGNSIDYRLAIKSERIPSCGGAVTDMMICPPIDSDKYFCGWRCFQEWCLKACESRIQQAKREAYREVGEWIITHEAFIDDPDVDSLLKGELPK